MAECELPLRAALIRDIAEALTVWVLVVAVIYGLALIYPLI